MNMAERLGFRQEDRLLIVNADDFGLCHSANVGILRLLKENEVGSATIMMNCPWSAEAAAAVRKELPGADIGIHWTLTSEWPSYRWGPLSRAGTSQSLAGPAGWFPADAETVERKANPEEVRRELVAQTEAALQSGLTLTHADNHMGSLYGLVTGKDLLHVAFDVCSRFGLPFRLPRKLLPVGGGTIPQDLQDRARKRARQAEDLGIALPDYITGLDYRLAPGEAYEAVKAEGIRMLKSLLPGVTEWITHPSAVADELKAFHAHWEKRGMEQRFWSDADVKRTLSEEKIRMIGWKDMKRYQDGLSG